MRRSSLGFSLIEALVAMAIAAVATTVLYRTVGQSSHVTAEVENRVEAALVAKSVYESATFADDMAAMPEGRAGHWLWRVQVVPEVLPIHDIVGQAADLGNLVAGRVDITVLRDGLPNPVLTWSGWKPYRKVP